MLRLHGNTIELPALASAHSHAFQRALRGAGQRRATGDQDDFWSWREAMYDLAASLTPDSMHAIARVAYRELHRSGVRTVGEFHYLHHGPGGVAYAERTAMADAVIEAAKAEGMRIALLRVIYARGGPGREAETHQLRFVDARLDDAFADVESLALRYRSDPNVCVGVAAHSVRAVAPNWLRPIADFARARAMPLHMHVAEQPREIEECLAETGRRPVELLADLGVLASNFTAVHATHLTPAEAKMLGANAAGVCLCPTTERDLGDGLPNVTALLQAGVALSVGVDSHVLTAPLEDLRGVELGERLRLQKRCLVTGQGTVAETLWQIGSRASELACGFSEPAAPIAIDRTAAALAYVEPDQLLDGIVFGAGAEIFQ